MVDSIGLNYQRSRTEVKFSILGTDLFSPIFPKHPNPLLRFLLELFQIERAKLK